MGEAKQIKLFYFTNLLSSVFGGLGGLLLLGFLSQAQYGTYTLFITFVMQFMILSFGYPDGLLINYREDDGKLNIKSVAKDLAFISKRQVIICIFSLVIFNLLSYLQILNFGKHLTIIINLALITVLPQTLIDNFRAIFISLKDFKNISIIDAFNKSYYFIMVIPVLIFNRSPHLMIWFMLSDAVFRTLFLGYLYYVFKKKYGPQISNFADEQLPTNRHFKKGLFLLFGNWLVILIYSLDKMFLSKDPINLGLYTQALFFFGIIYQIIMPFKDVIFVKIDEKMDNRSIFLFSMYMMLGIFLLICIFSYIIVPGALFLCQWIANMHITSFGIEDMATKFIEYSHALSLSQQLVVMIPTYITVQLVLDNLLMIKMQSRYAIKTLFNFIVAVMIFIVCANLIPNLLTAVVVATIINSIILFFNNLLSVTNIKCASIGLLVMSVVILLYYLGLKYWIFEIIIVVILAYLVFKLYQSVGSLKFNRKSKSV